MAVTAQEAFAKIVQVLPANERLRLAALILQDLAHSVDTSDAWGEQDQRDLAAFSLQYSAKLYPEEGAPAVQLVPVPSTQSCPRFGSAKGKIKMAEDFDAFPDDFGEYAP